MLQFIIEFIIYLFGCLFVYCNILSVQAGWGVEQPGLLGGVPAYIRRLELMNLKVPSNHSMSL